MNSLTSRYFRLGNCVAWLACLALAPESRGAPRVDSIQSEFQFQVWETDQGMPQNSALSIAQTTDGYLWIATFGGLARFDGVKFVVMDKSSTSNFPSDVVTKLYADKPGRLWASTDRGLACLAGGRWQVYRQEQGWPGPLVASFVEDREGNLYVTTGTRMLQLTRDRFVDVAVPDRGPDDSNLKCVVDSDGVIWGMGDHYFGRFEQGKWISVSPETRRDSERVLGIAPSRDGGVWMATESRIQLFKNGKPARAIEHRPQNNWEPLALFEDTPGNVWVGAFTGGLSVFLPEGSELKCGLREGLRQDAVRAVFEDLEGNVWVGTDGGGLIRFRPRTFKMYDSTSGLPENIVKTIAEERPGVFLVGTHGGGVVRLQNEQFTPPIESPGSKLTRDSWVGAVCVDPDGGIWTGTYGAGLFRLSGRTIESVPLSTDATPIVYALHAGSDGTLWIGTDSGLAVRRSGGITVYGANEGLHATSIRAIAEDRAGGLWVGSADDGMYRFQAGQFVKISLPQGIPEEIWALTVDEEGILWIGSAGGGLIRLRDGRFTSYYRSDGLPIRNITCVIEDGLGYLWLGSHQGIVRVSKQQLEAYAAVGKGRLDYLVFDRSDGLNTTECSGGYQPTCLRGSDGRLWFATVKGLAVVNPKTIKLNPYPPPTRVERIAADGEEMPIQDGGSVTLPAGTRRLQVHYTGLSFAAPHKMKFQYRIDGRHDDWIDAGGERFVNLDDLGAGRHQFQVRASNNDGVWGNEGATLAFTILPFFWQTAWFRSLAAIGGLAVLGGGIWRGHSLRARRKAEEAARASEHFAHGTINALSEHICVLDEHGRIVAVNRSWREFSRINNGDGNADPIGTNYLEVCDRVTGVPAEDAHRFADGIRRVIFGELDEFAAEYACHAPDQPRWFIGRVTRFNASGRLRVVVAHENITERKRAEEALKRAHHELERRVTERTVELRQANELLENSHARLMAMSMRLVEIQEAERRGIARELHDEIGQLLTGLKLMLDLASREIPEGARQNVYEAQALAGDLLQRVRQLSLELRPAMLDDLGLKATLEWHFRRFTKMTSIVVRFEEESLAGRLAPQIETAAYRIVQEALTNVARHAGAKEVFVTLRRASDALVIVIRDCGRGFDVARTLSSSSTIGLSGMQERVDLLHGKFEVASIPGSGTTLTVRVPVVSSLNPKD